MHERTVCIQRRIPVLMASLAVACASCRRGRTIAMAMHARDVVRCQHVTDRGQVVECMIGWTLCDRSCPLCRLYICHLHGACQAARPRDSGRAQAGHAHLPGEGVPAGRGKLWLRDRPAVPHTGAPAYPHVPVMKLSRQRTPIGDSCVFQCCLQPNSDLLSGQLPHYIFMACASSPHG